MPTSPRRPPASRTGRLAGVVAALLVLGACSGSTATPSTTTVPAAPSSTTAPSTTATGAPTTTTTGGPTDPALTPGPAPDYADPANWLALPAGTPAPVDVFYLAPSAYRRADADAPVFGTTDDPGMRQRAQAAFDAQATAFAAAGNVFSPYYRQVDAAYALTRPLPEQAGLLGGPPTEDATAAFESFLARHNDGRPFILVGHSQGAAIVENLLSGYLAEHPDVAERLVAAYVIGWSVTADELAAHPHLRFAERADDTGVIVSYSTEAPTTGGPNPVVHPGAVAVNPVSWTRTAEPAPASASLGARLPDETGSFVRMPGYADARVDPERGVVVTTTADVDRWAPGIPGFPRGIFHTLDIPLYYYDLEANARLRADAYLAAHPS